MALRPWGATADDAGALAAAWADPDIVRWTAVPARRSAADAARWLAGEAARRHRRLALDLVVTDPPSGRAAIGEVGLAVVDREREWAEVGYWLLPPWRGTGRATVALTLFSDWVLASLPVRRLLVRTHAANPASAAVARRAAYQPAGRLDDGTGLWVRDAAHPVDGMAG